MHTHKYTEIHLGVHKKRYPIYIFYIDMKSDLSSNIQPTSMYTGSGNLGEQWVGERECRLLANQCPNVEPGARLPSLHSFPLLNLFINMFMFMACQTSPCSWQGTAGSVPNLGHQEQVCRPLHTIVAPQWSWC